ncbi:flavodoxin domain-containing protein [Paludicola sp. MB14-C6]|uniref:flavodoxin domain-containing protein n=1 Tax=Paludihabitans sp. MB14-C6 TaxID=3070656 RepID=UPI0027DCEA37|nr:flavodoxin domain-containing protein [Paludicola sp. MB14-C6]WMJ24000.1 flavodoxin domain-containing protein [Paludicola sp. MB14-C6]
MNTVVVYQSKTGFTKTYAEWIAKELNCDLKENVNLTVKDIINYDTIIYGGGLYAVSVCGIGLIKKNFETLKEKNLIVWATGCSPGHKEEMQQLWAHNFTQEQLSHIKTFYLRGGFNYQSLSKEYKILMGMLKMKLKATKNRTQDENDLLKAYEEPQDYRTISNIYPLIEHVKTLH